MKKIIIVGILVVAVVGLIIFIQQSNHSPSTSEESSVAIPASDPLDMVSDFYASWLSATFSTSTDPVSAGLLDGVVISPTLATRLRADIENLSAGAQEPILCQIEIPPRMGGKMVFAEDTSAQVIMFARGASERSPYQSIVTLEAVDGEWQISDLYCAQGEVAPLREYDFIQDGFILKDVPAPLDNSLWHLVYTKDDVLGHTIPLFFNENSVCVEAEGTETACNPDGLTEATPAILKADMTEAGAVVRRLEF